MLAKSYFEPITWDSEPIYIDDIIATKYKEILEKPFYIEGKEFRRTVPKKSSEIIKMYETEYADKPKHNANFKISEKPNYERLTNAKSWADIDLKEEYGYKHIWERLKELEDKIESGELVFREVEE